MFIWIIKKYLIFRYYKIVLINYLYLKNIGQNYCFFLKYYMIFLGKFQI